MGQDLEPFKPRVISRSKLMVVIVMGKTEGITCVEEKKGIDTGSSSRLVSSCFLKSSAMCIEERRRLSE